MEKIRIALIEDEDLIRQGLRDALTTEPSFEWVGDAPNGKLGLALMAQKQPDVVIIDIGLPDMNGIIVTQQLKRGPRDCHCRVVILTLNDQEETVLAAFSAGADAYCMKDSRPELLIEAIQATHSGFAWIDPAIARIVLAHSNAPGPGLAAPLTSSRAYGLTERELEVLQLIVDGGSNADIAARLYITVGTVKTHVRNILNKLCANDRTEAAVRAIRSGLVK